MRTLGLLLIFSLSFSSCKLRKNSQENENGSQNPSLGQDNVLMDVLDTHENQDYVLIGIESIVMCCGVLQASVPPVFPWNVLTSCNPSGHLERT
jgi:hypothetical protein